jgi:hypothetical protein
VILFLDFAMLIREEKDRKDDNCGSMEVQTSLYLIQGIDALAERLESDPKFISGSEGVTRDGIYADTSARIGVMEIRQDFNTSFGFAKVDAKGILISCSNDVFLCILIDQKRWLIAIPTLHMRLSLGQQESPGGLFARSYSNAALHTHSRPSILLYTALYPHQTPVGQQTVGYVFIAGLI